MRISDWSSDVCSSDLEAGVAEHVLDVELPAVDLRRLLVHRHVDAEHRQRIARLAGDGAGRLPVLADAGLDHPRRTGIVVEIGRASCRARVCQYVYILVVAVSFKKNINK